MMFIFAFPVLVFRPAITYLRSESNHISRMLTMIPTEWERKPLIVWSDKLSIGVLAMDEQHKVLVNLINEFYRAVLDLRSDEMVHRVLDGVLDYTVKHFREEEELITNAGYSETVSHKARHTKLISQVVDYVNRLKQGESGVDFRLMTFLRNWLTGHILGHDKKYARFLNSRGIH